MVVVGAASVLDMCICNALGVLGITGALSLNTLRDGDTAAIDFTPCLPKLNAEVRAPEAASAARHAREAILVDRILLFWLYDDG